MASMSSISRWFEISDETKEIGIKLLLLIAKEAKEAQDVMGCDHIHTLAIEWADELYKPQREDCFENGSFEMREGYYNKFQAGLKRLRQELDEEDDEKDENDGELEKSQKVE